MFYFLPLYPTCEVYLTSTIEKSDKNWYLEGGGSEAVDAENTIKLALSSVSIFPAFNKLNFNILHKFLKCNWIVTFLMRSILKINMKISFSAVVSI